MSFPEPSPALSRTLAALLLPAAQSSAQPVTGVVCLALRQDEDGEWREGGEGWMHTPVWNFRFPCRPSWLWPRQSCTHLSERSSENLGDLLLSFGAPEAGPCASPPPGGWDTAPSLKAGLGSACVLQEQVPVVTAGPPFSFKPAAPEAGQLQPAQGSQAAGRGRLSFGPAVRCQCDFAKAWSQGQGGRATCLHLCPEPEEHLCP